MKIGIIIAMDKEFSQIARLLENPEKTVYDNRTYVTGMTGGNTIVMMQCGIGKVNAAVGASQMIAAFNPDIVISTGVAGGASTLLEVQDIVVAATTCYHDVYCGPELAYGQVMGMPERFLCAEDIVSKATALDCATKIHAGLIVTGDWFVDTVDKMQEIIMHFPDAMAVDMESAAIAHACYMRNVPFVSFRITSDIPLKKGNAKQYTDFWGSMADKSFSAVKALLEALN